jgi:CHAD domain-containing protein
VLEQPVEEIVPQTAEGAAPATGNLDEPVHEFVEMKSGEVLAEAGRGFLHHQLIKLRKAEPIAREGIDPEGVHDMRVATRRLRAALKLLGETVYDPQVTGRYRQGLRRLANALGETRDTDVFLEHLKDYIAPLSEEDQAGLDPLRRELVHRHHKSRKAMLKALDSDKTEKLLRRLERFVNTPGMGLAPNNSKDDNEAVPTLVRHFAASAIWRRYEEVLAYETVVEPQTSVATLHHLRIACKRLRYTIEFFEEALPVSGYKSLHDQLIKVQDELGILHDHQVAGELSEKLLKANPDDQALQSYHTSRLTEIERIKSGFPAHWQTLTGNAYRKQLATSLAALGDTAKASKQ